MRKLDLGAALWTVTLACSSSSSSPDQRDSAVGADTSPDIGVAPLDIRDTAPESLPAGACQGGKSAEWEAIKAKLGPLVTIAGKGLTDQRGTVEWKAGFENGPAKEAELSRPHFAQADGAGNIYIADKEAHAIRKVSPAGIITTVAGTGLRGNGDDGDQPALSVALANPNGIFVRPDGTLYILDLDNAKIRRVTPGGRMKTLFAVPGGLGAGRGLHVKADESEAFVAASTVVKRWSASTGVTDHVDGFTDLGNLVMDGQRGLLVSDRGGGIVYAVTGAPGAVTKKIIAGSGTDGVAVDCQPALAAPLVGVRAVWPAFDGFFVGLHEGRAVLYVDGSGFVHPFLDRTSVGELRSVSVDGQGNLILVDDDRGIVRRVPRLP